MYYSKRSTSIIFSALVLCLSVPHTTAYGQANGIANITFQWTDRNGGIHPLLSTWTVGNEDDSPFGSSPAGTGFTSAITGISVFTGSDLTPFDSQTEFFGTVNGWIGAGTTAVAQINDTGGTIYSQNWPATGTFNVPDPPGSASFTYTVNNTSYSGTALGMMQAVNFMRNYYAGKGLNTPYLNVTYDGTTSGSFYQNATTNLQIDANDWASWDVIFHEMGHYIAAKNNLDGVGYGGAHNFGQDLINTTGDINIGTLRAYGEGVATVLGLLAVNDGNLAAAIPGLPAKDYNTNYDTFATPANASVQNDTTNVGFNISAENRAQITGASGQNKGEGDEMSVLRVLWDVYDASADGYSVGNDSANFGAAGLLGLMAGADIFEDFWDNLANAAIADPTKVGLAAAATQYQVLGKLGEILQEYNVGHRPVAINKVDSTPRLEFDEQNNDQATRHRFVILNEALTAIVDDLDFADNAGLSTWFWDVTNPLAPGNYYFAALGNSAIDMGASPGTDREWYWSSLEAFEVVPETSTVVMMSIAFTFMGLAIARQRWAKHTA